MDSFDVVVKMVVVLSVACVLSMVVLFSFGKEQPSEKYEVRMLLR